MLFVTDSFPVTAVQKLSKPMKTCQSYWQKFIVTFLWTTVYCSVAYYSVLVMNYSIKPQADYLVCV